MSRWLLWNSLVIVAGLVASGCDRSRSGDLLGPSAGPPPTPGQRQLIRIVSGADLRPVAFAQVLIDGAPHASDVTGHIAPGDDVVASESTPIDVEAAGFLPRKTRIPADRLITLWPVADSTEADAVRRMVYGRGAPFGEVRHPRDPAVPFDVTLEDRSPEVRTAWNAGAQEFSRLLDIPYSVDHTFSYETGEITVRFDDAIGCATTIWAFCLEDRPAYAIFRVRRDRALDPQVIRRVLASWFLGPNPLPGFLNAQAPADELSPLEIQTMRMMLQRRLPNRWPDTDR